MAADGIKMVNQLTLTKRDYLELPAIYLQLSAVQCNHKEPLYVDKVGKRVRVHMMSREKT